MFDFKEGAKKSKLIIITFTYINDTLEIAT